MQIDWITVAAQVINFLILVYLLRRFLYQPVMRAMQRREAEIARQLQEAELREQAARAQADELRAQQSVLERERVDRLRAVDQEVETLRKSLLEQVRQEVDANRQHWHAEMERERQEHLRQFRPRVAASLMGALRRLLGDLADATLEHQLIGTFVRHLASLHHSEVSALRRNARKSGRLQVSTSFEADAETRKRIRHALQHHLLEEQETDIQIEFRCTPELLCGIEVDTDGQQIGWTLANYLDALEAELGLPASSIQEVARV